MFGNSYRGYVQVQNGRSNGRGLLQGLKAGRITISGLDLSGRRFQRVVEVVGGEIMDNCLRMAPKAGGARLKVVHRIAYGKFEVTLSDAGKRDVISFAKGGTGKHGKARRWERLFGKPGVCHSWYKRGRLVRQKFIFDNGRQAYDWTATNRTGKCVIRNSQGAELYRIEGALDGRQQWRGHSVFARPMDEWFLSIQPFKVFRYGREIFSGQYHNRQKVGRWIEPKGDNTLMTAFGLKKRRSREIHEVFYEHGVAIPRKLYETPPEQLDPQALFKIDNAQVRMALLSKIKPAKLAQVGRLVHKQRDMRLFDVPGMDVRILKVVCPSTKSVYHIRVPKDAVKCEEARQWTFHVGAGIRPEGNRIKFAQET
jgi:hypothetical protein